MAGFALMGRRVLLVEDESLIAMLIEDLLDELGCVLEQRAASLAEAMEAARTTEAEAAILDVNLAGDRVFPAAELLAGRGVPILFSTGYGSAGLEPPWRSHPVLRKPYTRDALGAALEGLLVARR